MKTKKVLIKVTQNHINRGTRSNAYACPIALAISEKLKPGIKCATFSRLELIDVESKKTIYAKDYEGATKKFYEFAIAFDYRDPVKPFQGYLELPVDVLK